MHTRFPAIECGEIHIWSVWLENIEPFSRQLDGLSCDEQERASRFKNREVRNRWVSSRRSLRLILGKYFGVEAGNVRFRYEENGKPVLDHGGGPPIHFNASLSGELLVVALTWLGPLGADVERIGPMPDAMKFAREFFADAEWHALQNLPEASRELAFFKLSTRKEAYLKAKGDGLSGSLSDLILRIASSDPMRIVVDQRSLVGGDWKLYEFDPVSGYVGAIAINTPDECKLRHLQCSTHDFQGE